MELSETASLMSERLTSSDNARDSAHVVEPGSFPWCARGQRKLSLWRQKHPRRGKKVWKLSISAVSEPYLSMCGLHPRTLLYSLAQLQHRQGECWKERYQYYSIGSLPELCVETFLCVPEGFGI